MLEKLIKFVDEFLWRSSNDVHAYALQTRKSKKKPKQKRAADNNKGGIQGIYNDWTNVGGVVDEEESEEESSEDDGDPLVIEDDDDSDEVKDDGQEMKENHDQDDDNNNNKVGILQANVEKKKEEDEVEEVEEQTVQIHEIYATLWANEKIILQLVDVLSVLKATPITLDAINREWGEGRDQQRRNERSLGECLGQIMTKLLDAVQTILIEATKQGLKERVDYLLSTSQSFVDILEFLGSDSVLYRDVETLRKKWNIIRLSMICVSACPGKITGTFIDNLKRRFGDHKFDNIVKLGALIQIISDTLGGDVLQKHKNETLQWFLQNYIRFFAFSSEISNQFANSLINVIAEEKDQISNDLTIQPNLFTKFEIALQFLFTINNNDTVMKILSTVVEERDLSSSIASLLSRAVEQKLHHNMMKTYMVDSIVAPKKKEVINAATKLTQSFELSKLEQVLAISECKVILYYFIKYLQSILAGKGKIDEQGIWYQKRQIKRPSYLQAIGSILKMPDNCSQHIRSINTFQYFFVAEIWNVGGAQNAILLISKSVFPCT